MAPSIKLHYFAFPGRAEAARILLHIGNVPHEEVTYPWGEGFAEHKSKFPFGQLPAVEVDGQMIAQSTTVDRYIAKLAGLYPADALEAAKADQAAAAFLEAVFDVFSPWYVNTLPASQQAGARAMVVEGPYLKGMLANLEKLVAAAGSGYLAGPKLSYADIVAYTYLCFMISGAWEGIPTNILEPYPALSAFRSRIASLPEVRSYLAKYTDGSRAPFMPSGASSSL